MLARAPWRSLLSTERAWDIPDDHPCFKSPKPSLKDAQRGYKEDSERKRSGPALNRHIQSRKKVQQKEQHQKSTPAPQILAKSLETSFDFSASLSLPGVRTWFDNRVREQSDPLSKSAPPIEYSESEVGSGIEKRFSASTGSPGRKPFRPQSQPYHPWKFGRGLPLESPRSRKMLRKANNTTFNESESNISPSSIRSLSSAASAASTAMSSVSTASSSLADEFKPTSAMQTSPTWQRLDPQVRYRLIRMEKELGTVPGKIRHRIRQAEVPAFQKRTKELQQQFKMLRSKRKALEEEIPYVINTVRAQKTPEDAFTRCWDPSTGVKMRVKDIEKALEKLEQRIEDIKPPMAHQERLVNIYKHMLNRYKNSTNKNAQAADEIRFQIKGIKREMEPKKTALREVEDAIAAMNVEIRTLLEKRETRRLMYKRTLLSMKTEHEEDLKMIKLGLQTKKRQQLIAEKERNRESFQTKIDVRKVETLTARGAKSFLLETKRTSIPIKKAMEKLEKHGELRDGIDFQEYFLAQQNRSNAVKSERKSLEENLTSRKSKLAEIMKERQKIERQGLHLYIKKENDISLWEIQEKIDLASRKEEIAESRCRKLDKLLAMVKDGITNVIRRFRYQNRLEREFALEGQVFSEKYPTLNSTSREQSPLSSASRSRPSSSLSKSGHRSTKRPKRSPKNHGGDRLQTGVTTDTEMAMNEGENDRSDHHHHRHRHHHHHQHQQHDHYYQDLEDSPDDYVLTLLDDWLNNMLSKEKRMHNKFGVLLANKARRFCKQISDLEFYKSGRLFVKARGDTLMTIRSLGLQSMMYDPIGGHASPKRMLKKIKLLNQRSRVPTGTAEKSINKSPIKKKLRRRSILAAAKQVTVSNRMKKLHQSRRSIAKKKEINLFEDLEMFKKFMLSSQDAHEGGGWTQSKLNFRVGVSEVAGKNETSIDGKSLAKANEPEETALIQDLRKEGKSHGENIMKKLKHSRTKRENRSFEDGGEHSRHGNILENLRNEATSAAARKSFS